jgi:hypothetical protein
MKGESRCDFCGRAEGEAVPPGWERPGVASTKPVLTLVPGPGVFICDQCVELAREFVAGAAELI